MLFPLDICAHREVSSLYDVGDDDGEKDNDNKCEETVPIRGNIPVKSCPETSLPVRL